MRKFNLTDANEWFSIGENEFGFACLGLNDKQDSFYAQICFMFQQAMEKYLKGYLAAHNMEIKKVHDLGYLCKQCSLVNKKFMDFYEECKIVSQYYIPSRYPAHWPDYTKKQAKESYRIAGAVIDFIKNDLKI